MEGEKDGVAPGTVAIAGVVAICNELAAAGLLGKAAIGRISEYMHASIQASGASQKMQSHLHEASDHHLGALYARMAPDNPPPEPEGPS